MALYRIDEAFPADLVKSFSGLPCRTRSKTCGMRLNCLRAGILTEVRIDGRATCVVEYLPPNGGVWTINGMFDEPLHIMVTPPVPHSVNTDKESFVSTWKGSLQVEAAATCHIKFEAPDAPSTTVGHHRMNYCTIEVRDVSVKFVPVATSLSSQLAVLFDNVAALSAQDTVVVRFKDASAPRLHVSKFILQLRSPVFKAELDSPFREAASLELSFDDFPPASVRCFMEMLHKDEYTGPLLGVEDAIAVFALGDKYDVLFVQDAVKNELEERELGPEELQGAFVAAHRYRVSALQPIFVKKLRWLDHEEMCTIICASAAEQSCISRATAASARDRTESGSWAR